MIPSACYSGSVLAGCEEKSTHIRDGCVSMTLGPEMQTRSFLNYFDQDEKRRKLVFGESSQVSHGQVSHRESSQVSHGESSQVSHGESSSVSHGESSQVSHGESSPVSHGESSQVSHGESSQVSHGESSPVSHGEFSQSFGTRNRKATRVEELLNSRNNALCSVGEDCLRQQIFLLIKDGCEMPPHHCHTHKHKSLQTNQHRVLSSAWPHGSLLEDIVTPAPNKNKQKLRGDRHWNYLTRQP
ncbi:hypothetical protein RRG08_018396 [Elysia crispata]|uniref:Uncharacterized protein n=1 Tax=Elysia crispata TaxID=231223 RepID=A0AAE1AD80_9GAST|nr:hypothetical protein RRG08_018396 [Elysia crispata]